MRSASFRINTLVVGLLLLSTSGATAQDWPQWRGPNRDGKAPVFKAPATWPAALTKKWDTPVGDGDAGPVLVGDRLYVFSREDGNEVIRAVNALSGAPIWSQKYPASPMLTGDSGHAGPRSTPTVADGKVVTLGVDGMLTCWNAADGKQLWQKDEFVGKSPQFHTASAPIVVDGVCIAQLGERPQRRGAMVAYDLATGAEKWRVNEGSGSYGSPVLMTVGGTRVLIGPSETNMVAVSTDGKLMWQLPYRQGRYNSSTPIVDGQVLVIAGPENGITALKMTKEGDKLKEEQIAATKYTEASLAFSTPVLKDGALFGLSSNDQLFCVVDATSPQPKTGWMAPIGRPAGMGFVIPAARQTVFAQQQGDRQGPGPGGPGGGGGQPRRGGRGGGGGGGGYGTVIDAGSVLFALSPAANLIVFTPNQNSFSEVARYRVSEDGATFGHPVVSGNRIYVKDKDSVTLWTIE